jgi:hypothetical protein
MVGFVIGTWVLFGIIVIGVTLPTVGYESRERLMIARWQARLYRLSPQTRDRYPPRERAQFPSSPASAAARLEDSDLTSQLTRVAELRSRGALSEHEFFEAKRRLLASSGPIERRPERTRLGS